ncbi:uncharacterized protein LOC114136276 isoform X3 [Xiphophorus couchianus]|uniref:uncharacterized protein LOC114136276 isoform X3 n=1 Tax=Xiphophorus couchianus TaxID=32473 RepID=UPI001016F91B|nr:uncharacterized protein LOC114136276 isoform X3 [Xiphophorus couchianus]
MTAADLLSLTKQSSPANIDVTCYYLKSHPSPNSNLLSIIIQLPPPELTVNPQQITETDSVTVNCGTSSFVSVENCFLYFINSKMSRSISCEQTLTGSELLTHQTSPAEVELKCYYMVTRGGMHQSPYSNTSTVSVHKVQETDSTTSQRVTTVSVTAGQTFRTTIETESPFSPPPSSVNPTLFATTDPSGRTTVNTVSTLSTSPSEATDRTGISESDLLTRPLTPTLKDLTTSQTIVPAFPVSTVMMIWRFIAVGITSLILFGLTLKCCISRMEKCFSKRSKAEVSVEQIQMSSLNNRDE